jgi:hypothetical protein
MSLYNVVFGENEFASPLLVVLGLKREELPRYRDCWWNGKEVVLVTRSGGGNREAYQSINDALTFHAHYLRDEDNSFDSTYAIFYFRMPDEHAHIIPKLVAQVLTPAERWKQFFAKLSDPGCSDDPDVKRTIDVLRPMYEAIARGDNGGVFEIGGKGPKERDA